MFLMNLREEIEKDFLDAVAGTGQENYILEKLENCIDEEKTAMQFLYASMPDSDMADYDFAVFLDYVKHGLFLRKNGAYTDKIPDSIFMNYVMHHRINTEDIEPCRSFFYEQIKDDIQGMDMMQAALAVNYWCAKEATYQTTDDRTAGPMTVYRSGFGRCGEESTFTVTALRSVGIPARQVYAPRWSHCDDNHAWVEVWIDGKWYFIGACEPEEIVNRGWFTNASSRAMMIHSKSFYKNKDEQEDSREKVIGSQGIAAIHNHLGRYALTQKVCVEITDIASNAVQGVKVDFEVLNYSELYPVATAYTDEQGQAVLETGMGSIHLHAEKDGKWAEAVININELERGKISLQLSEDYVEKTGSQWEEFEMIAPVDSPVNYTQLNEEQEEIGTKRQRRAKDALQAKILAFSDKVDNSDILSLCINKPRIQEILKASRGNAQEIESFLREPVVGYSENLKQADNPRQKDSSILIDGLQQTDKLIQQLKEEFLNQLTEKDYRDCKNEIIMPLFKNALQYYSEFADDKLKDIYFKYILNPRIELEMICDYVRAVNGIFSSEEKDRLTAEPQKIWELISDRVTERPHRLYPDLHTSPAGCLKSGLGDELSKKILFVAMCRTWGIPARLNPVTKEMEYWQAGIFKKVVSIVKSEETAELKIVSDGVTEWRYMENWTLGLLKDGNFITLQNISNPEKGSQISLELHPGIYRLLTSNRLPNGNIFAEKNIFELKNKEIKEICLRQREAKLEDMLENITLPDFKLIDNNGKTVTANEVLADKNNIVVWLDEGKEPSEHILNELMEKNQEFQELDTQILFVLRGQTGLQDPTLKKVLHKLPKAQVYYDDFVVNPELLGRRLYVEVGKYPLIFVTKQGLNAVYAVCGYNVGTGEMLLRILK